MSDKDNESTTEEETPTTPECSLTLSSARQQQNLSVEEVAGRLNLPRERIRELESGQLSSSISPAFYRGYIRTYSHLLNLDPAQLVEQFSELLEEPEAVKSSPRITSFTQGRRELNSGSSIFKWITAIVIIAIIAAVSWGVKERFFSTDSNSQVQLSGLLSEDEEDNVSNNESNSLTLNLSESDTSDAQLKEARTSELNQVDSVPVEQDQGGSNGTERPLQERVSEEVVNQKSSNQENANQETAVQTKANGDLATDKLTMAFVGDCWIDVRDANNERLAFGTKNNGQVISVEGQAPFNVTLGDPSVVRVQLNQNDVDLTSYRAGRPARLTIEQ